VALAPSGHTLATVGLADRTVTLWDLTPLEDLRGNMVEEACKRAGGPLDKASWDAYALESATRTPAAADEDGSSLSNVAGAQDSPGSSWIGDRGGGES
jgi:hypothetical protein